MIAIIPGSFIVAALGDFIGDIILTNRAYNFLQIVIIAGAIITLFIIVRYGIKKYPEISHFKIPSTLDQNKNDNVLNK